MDRPQPDLRSPNRSRSGFTLIEILVVLMVLTTFITALGGVIISSQAAFVETMTASAVDDMACRTLDRVVWELRFAPLSTLSPSLPVNARSLSFCKAQGWLNGQPVLTPTQTFSFAGGKVTLNGNTIADSVKDFSFTLSGTILTAAVEVEKTTTVNNQQRVFNRRLEVRIPF
jgi:prepilin-type N-terminal cleavage/methylation domain-containing protein